LLANSIASSLNDYPFTPAVTMPKLKIKRDDFVLALTSHFDLSDSNSYFDTETGEILLTGDGVEEETPQDIDDNPRYLWIEPIESHESFRIMEDFVASVSDTKAAARLAAALSGPKPFRRFKDALLDFPALRQAWFAFEGTAHASLAQAWCEANGIEVEWV
jgi:Uncharacterised protein family (UPF0158)